ncbi:hypothetical protein EDC01DRAFT_627342 [Geopyxis carbonaria]|nr:hypothetical protein EDC01DRAFT_627342 [Geopyxis carbonaria]
MEKTSGTSRRDEGGGSGSGGASKAGKKSDDDEDWRKRRVVDRANREDTSSLGVRVRVMEKLKVNGMRLLHRHLHGRQDIQAGVQIDVALAVGDANTASENDPMNPSIPVRTSATRTSTRSPIDTSASQVKQKSSNQVVLSSTPPPSPAETGPSLSSTFPTISVNSVSSGSNTNNLTSTTRKSTATKRPATTVTSYITSAVARSRNSTVTSTSWSYSRTTTEQTVIIYAFPTLSSRSSTRISSRSRNSTRTSTQSSTRSIPSSTVVLDGLGGGAPSIASVPSSSTSPSPTAEASSGPNANNKIIGGVLGGLAGLGLILFAILMLLKRHKRNLDDREIQNRVNAGYGISPPGSSAGGRTMAERSSDTPFAGAAAFFRRSRQSQVSEPASEEKGFYKVAGTGRKLPPVIGGPRPDPNTSSFYQDDDGRWVGGPGTPVSSADAGGPSRYSGFTATTTTASPTTSTAPGSSISPIGIAVSPPGTAMSPPVFPIAITGERHSRIQEEFDEVDSVRETTPVMPRPGFGSNPSLAGRDGLGRSLPSHDGSRASRFTEDIV